MRFGLKESILENISNILKKYKEVESAKIFGSRARGDYKNTSDIDIALFGNDKIKENILKEGVEFYAK